MKILIYYAFVVWLCFYVWCGVCGQRLGGQTNVQSSEQVAGVIPYIMGNNKMPELVFRLAFTDVLKLTISMLAPQKLIWTKTREGMLGLFVVLEKLLKSFL